MPKARVEIHINNCRWSALVTAAANDSLEREIEEKVDNIVEDYFIDNEIPKEEEENILETLSYEYTVEEDDTLYMYATMNEDSIPTGIYFYKEEALSTNPYKLVIVPVYGVQKYEF